MDSAERHKLLKSQGVCVKCGIEKAQPGRIMCFECAVKHTAMMKRRYYMGREAILQKMKEKREKGRET